MMATNYTDDELAIVQRIQATVERLAAREIPSALASCRSLAALEEACAAEAELVPADPRTGRLTGDSASLWRALDCGAKTAAYALERQRFGAAAFGR